MRHLRPDLRRQILEERAAERDVDQLDAAADAENGFSRFDEFAEQLDLVVVAHAVARPLGLQRLFAIRRRADIGAALQQQCIELVRVVAQAHVAPVQQPLAIDRRQHRDHDVARHDPIGNERIEILHGSAERAGRTRARRQESGRQADLQRARQGVLSAQFVLR